ncbi:MAG: hypothetical protein J1F02_11990 [Lachnospiraceae bacterium]|nr:hypothetical protein [Lachnospiraceae bacterium]
MEENDTIRLLKECDAGTKMAVSSIDEVLEKVHAEKFKNLLRESKSHHEELGNEIHSLLMEKGSKDKEPSPMAKGMSWLKTNVKIGMDSSDATIADLITDGCNMGVKCLFKYLNQYKAADKISRDICHRLVAIEDELTVDLRGYL